MRNPLGFFKELLEQPTWIPLWVGLLMVINLISVAFWEEPLARWILGVVMASAMLMIGLYARFGFEKILGLGHFLWIPLLAAVLAALPGAEGAFRSYLMIWAGATTVSLILDVKDVWSYLVRGARQGHHPRGHLGRGARR